MPAATTPTPVPAQPISIINPIIIDDVTVEPNSIDVTAILNIVDPNRIHGRPLA